MICRFIRAIEELTKALNRFSDVWGAGEQEEFDAEVARLKATNDRLEAKLKSQSKENA